MLKPQTQTDLDEADFECPFKNCTKSDFAGLMFSLCSSEEPIKKSILRWKAWLETYANAQVQPLRGVEGISEQLIEEIKANIKVMSPLTLTLFAYSEQMNQFINLSDSEKEKYMLEKLPDRFRARYRGNASCRSAREVLPEEESASAEITPIKGKEVPEDIMQVIEDLQSDNPPEYITKFLNGE